jgi:hypothetical protein
MGGFLCLVLSSLLQTQIMLFYFSITLSDAFHVMAVLNNPRMWENIAIHEEYNWAEIATWQH